MNIPKHVAIILDGNGRWAKSKGMPRNYGHVRGAQNLEVICRDAAVSQLYLDLYQDRARQYPDRTRGR